MPTIPAKANLTATSAEILNTIRDNASEPYKNAVPIADAANAENIREIGNTIMSYPVLQNEFLSALINRIGRVLITSRLYENPWSFFKKGMLEFGETVEEIFVNIARPFTFNPEQSESTIFKREIPDVRAAWHVMNYQKYYKQTIANDQLRQAFLSWQGITDLIAKIVDAMYTAANYDEFQTMKYMLAKNILSGRLYPITIPTVNAENMKTIVSTIKGTSNEFEFMSNKYNMAGVQTYSDKSSQYVIINAKFDAVMDVEVLASAFNMDKAEFMGRRVLVDSFGSLDIARLNDLFRDDPTYTEIGQAELAALDNIPAIMCDRDFFMIFDNFYNFTEQYNGEGLYWNYWYHVWKTFSVSPFANNAIFVPGTPTVSSVTVSPSTATVEKGQSVQLQAKVVTTDFAPQSVIWSSNAADVKVDATGLVYIPSATTTTSVIITATSKYDTTKSGTATLTIQA